MVQPGLPKRSTTEKPGILNVTDHKQILLYPKQQAFLDSPAHIRGFYGGIGTGKSFVGAYDLFRRAKAGRLYLVIAPTFGMLRDATFRSFKNVCNEFELTEAENKTEFFVKFRTRDGGVAESLFRSGDNPDNLYGPNVSGVWMDEASLLDHQVYTIAIGRAREAGALGWISATFTPKGRAHWTYKVFGKQQDDVEVFHATTRENPFLHEQFYVTTRQQYSSEMASQELEGNFVDLDFNGMFQREWLVRASSDGIHPLPPYSAGIDVSYRGKDSTVCVICGKAGMLCGWEVPVTTSAGVFETAKLIRQLTTGTWTWKNSEGQRCRGTVIHPSRVHIDASEGAGEVLYQRMREQGISVTPERFGARPSVAVAGHGMTRVLAGDIYANRRAELYGSLARRLDPATEEKEGFSLPTGYEKLWEELLAQEEQTNSSGKVLLIPKDEIRDAIGRSPDWSDALVLSAWRENRSTGLNPKLLDTKSVSGKRMEERIKALTKRLERIAV